MQAGCARLHDEIGSPQRLRARAQHACEAAHPSKPRIRKVMSTEASGETFSGNTARTVINRNNHGRERNKSVRLVARRSQMPRGIPPTLRQCRQQRRNQCSAGASSNEMRVP